MSEEVNTNENNTVPQEVVESKPLDRIGAIQIVLGIANHSGIVVKGIAETLKALESRKAQLVFLAEDCDNEQYKDTINALAAEAGVSVVEVPTWVELKDFCGLGLPSENIVKAAEEKGKEAKIKPRCSSAAIIDYGVESEARKYLEADIAGNK